MNICILLALVYIIGGVGILIMKKLQPEDKICFKILMRYGWSYEREEADLVYGNHELYKKES